jgi:hypothetical protein
VAARCGRCLDSEVSEYLPVQLRLDSGSTSAELPHDGVSSRLSGVKCYVSHLVYARSGREQIRLRLGRHEALECPPAGPLGTVWIPDGEFTPPRSGTDNERHGEIP